MADMSDLLLVYGGFILHWGCEQWQNIGGADGAVLQIVDITISFYISS